MTKTGMKRHLKKWFNEPRRDPPTLGTSLASSRSTESSSKLRYKPRIADLRFIFNANCSQESSEGVSASEQSDNGIFCGCSFRLLVSLSLCDR